MNKSQPITSSINLFGAPWKEAREKFCRTYGNGILFDTAAELFIFCAAIGVRIGKASDPFPQEEEEPTPVSVPHSVLAKQRNTDALDDLYAAAFFSRYLDPGLTDVERLHRFFEEGAPSDRHRLLEPYARTGVTHLLECTKDFAKDWPLIERVWSDLAELYEEPRVLGGEDSPEE